MGFLSGLSKVVGNEQFQQAVGGLFDMAEQGEGGEFQPPDINDRAAFAEKAAKAVAADIRMFSGCKDEQTSADVYDVSSFGLPPDSGPGGAGGACTNSLVLSLTNQPQCSWVELLKNMRSVLKQKGFTQVPQLSSSREIMLNGPFSVMHPQSNGRTKALYIGINYVGQQGELRGCHNDVHMMKKFIESQGFDPSNAKVLMDDGQNTNPDGKNIMEGFHWLISGAQEGDSLFMHYSGHGGSMPDDNGDDADGKDETLVPVDYQRSGQIRDDVIYKELVVPLPKGCMLTVVMDCCHSGSILDLPYNFEASDANIQQVDTGGLDHSMPNKEFNWAKALKVAMELYQMYKKGATPQQMFGAAAKLFQQF